MRRVLVLLLLAIAGALSIRWLAGERETGVTEEPRPSVGHGEATREAAAPSPSAARRSTVGAAKSPALPIASAEETVPLSIEVHTLGRVAGIRVEVGLDTAFRWTRLGEVVTDAEGRALLEVDVDGALVVPGKTRVTGAPLTPEHLRERKLVRLGDDPGERVVLGIPLERGCSILGRVLDADGALHERGGRVLLATAPDGVDRLKASASLRPDGTFAFHLTEPGTYHFLVRASDGGTATRRDLVVPPEGAHHDVELTLAGSGVLAGRVTDPNGRSLANVMLRARIPGADESWNYHDALANEGDRGLRGARTRTDERGRFRLRGLEPGSYVLLAGEVPLNDALVRTGATDLELSLVVHELSIGVFDHAGTALSRAKGTLETTSSGRPYAEKPRLSLSHLPREGEKHLRAPGGVHGPDGRVAFRIPAGVDYQLRIASTSVLHAELVTLGANEYLRLHDVVLPPPREPATLRIAVRDPAGEPLGFALRDPAGELHPVDPRLRLFDETGSELTFVGGPDEEGTWELIAPAGRYVAHAEIAERNLIHGGALPLFLPAELALELFTGQAVEHELRLPVGGRLEVLFELPPGEDPYRGWDFRGPENPVAIELRRGPGSGEPVAAWFFYPVPRELIDPNNEMSGRWAHRGTQSSIPAGVHATSEPLASGEYTLVATPRRGEARRARVVVRAGETVSVRLTSP